MALNLREVEVFRPYPHEVPEALLEQAGLNEEAIEVWLQAETLRVAKLGNEVLGVYAMDRIDAIRFRLHGVIVIQRVKRQGLGRWLVGHAIGVAESKGGRHLLVQGSGGARIYPRLGFTPTDDGHIFDMIQE